MSRKKIADGNGVAKSSWKSHEPRSANPSMSSFTRTRASASSSATRFGENSGSRNRRYLAWSGGATCNGMSGCSWPIDTASGADENTSGCRNAHIVSS